MMIKKGIRELRYQFNDLNAKKESEIVRASKFRKSSSLQSSSQKNSKQNKKWINTIKHWKYSQTKIIKGKWI